MSGTDSSSITIEKTPGAIIVRVRTKSLDENGLKLLRERVGEESAAGVVVIDLATVQMVPSLGLGALVQLASKCKARQQRLKLAALTPQVRQVFVITKLDRVLELSPSVEAAIES